MASSRSRSSGRMRAAWDRAARLSSRWPICRLNRPARARFHSARNNWSVASRSLCRAAASAASFCFAAFTATACASVARIMPQVVPMMPPTRARTIEAGRQDRPLVPPHELPQPVAHRRRARLHRLVVQVVLEVHRQAVGRLVAPRPVLLQRLHHDPVEVALDQQGQPGRLRPAAGRDFRQPLRRREPPARLLRLFLANDPQELVDRDLAQPLPLERRRAGQEFVQEHAQGIDVAAGVDVRAR